MAILALLAGGHSPEPLYPDFELQKIARLRSDVGNEHAERDADEYKAKNAAAFMLRMLPGRARLEVIGHLNAGDMAAAMSTAIRHGLVGWKNIVDKDGEAVKFTGRKDADGNVIGATSEDVDQIPTITLREIYEGIMNLTMPMDADFLG